jgi:hypothetical protein
LNLESCADGERGLEQQQQEEEENRKKGKLQWRRTKKRTTREGIRRRGRGN